MSTEPKVYPLRRGRSPSTYNASPMTRRRLKSKEVHDQSESDFVDVVTYNDNPKHLYGLDKTGCDLPDNLKFVSSPRKKQSWNLTNGRTVEKDEAPDVTSNKRHALLAVFLILLVASICEVVIWLDRSLVNRNHDLLCGETAKSKEMDSLQKSLKDQLTLISNLSSRIQNFKQNCTCTEQLHLLEIEDLAQKSLMEQLQEQVLTTVRVMTSFNDRMDQLQTSSEQEKKKSEEKIKKEKSGLCRGEECQLLSHNIYSSIQSSLEVYHADILGLPDFALESAGGSIHSPHHSDTCEVGAPIIKVFGMSLWQDPRSPRSVISPENLPGNCWAMKGTEGYIVIKIATSIHPTMITLEHLDKRLDQYSKESYERAPKDFEVYAWLDSIGDKKVKLGYYTYSRKKSAIQTFKVQKKLSMAVDFIELKILTNYGNKDCTCIYRFRVHGQSPLWHDYENSEET